MSFQLSLPIPEKFKPAWHYAKIAVGLAPPVLAAIGTVFPQAAVWGLFIQELLGGFGTIQPGLVQGALIGTAAKGLRDSEPKPG